MPTAVQYTCPMHPEIVRDAPGSCPICGMALEAMSQQAEVANPELTSMTRRFWVGLALTLPLLGVMVADLFRAFSRGVRGGGWSLRWLRRWCCGAAGRFSARLGFDCDVGSPNMFTLIAIGTGAAYRLQCGGCGCAGDISGGVSRIRRAACRFISKRRR